MKSKLPRIIADLVLFFIFYSSIADAQLVWNIEPRGNRLGPTSISWLDEQGAVIWTQPIPSSLRFDICCRDEKTETWLHDQKTDNYAKYWVVLNLKDGVLIEHEGGLIVYGLGDGHTLFEWTDETPSYMNHFEDVVIDYGNVVIDVDGKHCEKVLERSNFVVSCSNSLFYFDRGKLVQFSMQPYRLVNKISVRGPKLNELSGDCPGSRSKDVDQIATVGSAKIHFRGVRRTMCMN